MRELLREDLHRVVASLPSDIIELVKAHPSLMIAGGYIRARIAGEVPNDIDIFADSYETCRIGAVALAQKRSAQLHYTDNAITVLAPPRLPVQFITRWNYTTFDEVLGSFDFTICQAVVAWGISPPTWYGRCGDRFYEDLAAKRLFYISPAREEEPGGSMLRVLKFAKRGYSISPESLGAVMERLVLKIEPEKLGRAGVGQVITGMLREVDPLTRIDGLEMARDHEEV